MYKSYYSLAQAPFSKDIRPSDAYPSTDYKGAINGLNYLQKSKGIGLLIGDPGVGKTFTLRSFKESLSPTLIPSNLFSSLDGRSNGLLSWISLWLRRRTEVS